jgi:hypothetical protein
LPECTESVDLFAWHGMRHDNRSAEHNNVTGREACRMNRLTRAWFSVAFWPRLSAKPLGAFLSAFLGVFLGAFQ